MNVTIKTPTRKCQAKNPTTCRFHGKQRTANLTDVKPVNVRKLATIRPIDNITPIENADSIETLHFGGWTVVAKKGRIQRRRESRLFRDRYTPPKQCSRI